MHAKPRLALLASTCWSARRGSRPGGFGAVDHHHLVASRKVLLEVEEVLGVEGRAVEFAGAPVLLLHHEAGRLTGHDLRDHEARRGRVLLGKARPGSEIALDCRVTTQNPDR